MPSTVAQSAAPAADCRSPYNDCEDLPSYDPSPAAAAAAAAAAPPINGLGDGDAVAPTPAAAPAFERDAAVSAVREAKAEANATPSEPAVTPPLQPSPPSPHSVVSTTPPPPAAPQVEAEVAAAAPPPSTLCLPEEAVAEEEASPLPSSHVGETVSDEVWENERWLPSGGWRAPTSIDRSHFSDKSGSHARAKEGALLPHLWVWAAPWQVDTSGHASSSTSTSPSGPATPRRTTAPPSPQAGGGGNAGGSQQPSPFELPEEPEAQAEAAAAGSCGWYYARSFTTSISQCKLKPAKTDVVRRRRWARVRRRVSEAELADLVRQGAVGGTGHWVGCERYGFAPPAPETAPPASLSAVLAKRHHTALRAWRQHLRSNDPKHAYSDGVKIEGKPGDVKGKLKELVRKHGVPPSLRARLWMACSGAVRKKQENEGYYRCVIEKLHGHTAGGAVSPTAAAVGGGGGGGSSNNNGGSGDESAPAEQAPNSGGSPGGRGGNDAWCEELEKDLQRTFCDHPYFGGASCPGRQKLKRVLSALSYRNPLVNYCQSFNYIAGCLLLNMPEEDSFWMMVALLEQVLPNDYYNANLVGITVDIRVLGDLIALLLPTLAAHFAAHNIDVTPLTAGWLMNLYVNTFPIDTTMRVWDLLFSEGPKVIFRVMIGLLRTLEPELLGMTSLGETLEFLTLSCKQLHDPTELLNEGHSVNLGKTKLGKLRERHRRDVTKEVDMRKHISELERRGDDPHDGAAYPVLPVAQSTEEEGAGAGGGVATEAEPSPNPDGGVVEGDGGGE